MTNDRVALEVEQAEPREAGPEVHAGFGFLGGDEVTSAASLRHVPTRPGGGSFFKPSTYLPYFTGNLSYFTDHLFFFPKDIFLGPV